MSDLRFACPRCRQHYVVDASSRPQQVICSICGHAFWPGAMAPIDTFAPADSPAEPIASAPAAPPPAPPEAPALARPRPRVRVVGPEAAPGRKRPGPPAAASAIFQGIVTPPLVAIAMVLGLITGPLALIAVPAIGYYVSAKICSEVRDRLGREGFATYFRTALISFLVAVLLVLVLGYSVGDDEGAGLIMAPILIAGFVGIIGGFLVWLLAVVRS